MDIDSEGALCAFAVVHARGSGMGRETYGFFRFWDLTSDGICV